MYQLEFCSNGWSLSSYRSWLMARSEQGWKVLYRLSVLSVTFLVASCGWRPSRWSIRGHPRGLDKIARVEWRIARILHESDYSAAKLITITRCGCDEYWRAKSNRFQLKDHDLLRKSSSAYLSTNTRDSTRPPGLLTNGKIGNSASIQVDSNLPRRSTNVM